MTDFNENHRRTLSRAIATWFVRRDGKYYDVTNRNVPLSSEDAKQISIHRLQAEFPDIALSPELLKAVFKASFVQLSFTVGEAIPVWNGKVLCRPDIDRALILDQGSVSINSYTRPRYRDLRVNHDGMGVFGRFLDWIFPREPERQLFLDWLAWCLQNESDKPNWAPLLYSRTKGSGKSTLAEILAYLFGRENTMTQNNVSKLTGRFNMEVLLSKFIISEEVEIKPGSPASNAVKTYLTERDAVAEFKGREASRIEQCCCFLFTTNHMPLWIEQDDRRFYVIELDHDGHSSGPRAQEFAALVAQVKETLENDVALAALYTALIQRVPSEQFNAKSLNTALLSTDIMKRIQASNGRVSTENLREHLDGRSINAISEADLTRYFQEQLRANPESIRHHMSDLNWHRLSVKWGGVDYARSLWVRDGYSMYRGKLRSPDGTEIPFSTDLEEEARL